MNEFDLRLKAMANQETTSAPEGFDERLREQARRLTAGEKNRRAPLRTALVAACVCLGMVASAAAVGIRFARDAMREVYTMGMVYQQEGIRYEISEEFLDLLETEYTTEVKETVEGENMDVTLENVVAFETGDSCVVGYLVRFTLPDEVTLTEGENYYFGGSYHSRVEGSNEVWNGDYKKMILIPSDKESVWFAFLTQRLLGGLSERTAVLELSDFCTDQTIYTERGNLTCFKPLVLGEWTFEVDLDIKSGTVLTEETLFVVDILTQIQNLSVSPMGVELCAVRNGTFDTPADEAVGGWDTDDAAFDAWYDALVHNTYLILNSGERVELHPVGELTNDAERDLIEGVWFYSFATPVDLTCVSSVEVAGVEFPVPIRLADETRQQG